MPNEERAAACVRALERIIRAIQQPVRGEATHFANRRGDAATVYEALRDHFGLTDAEYAAAAAWIRSSQAEPPEQFSGVIRDLLLQMRVLLHHAEQNHVVDLCMAARVGDVETVRYLLDAGADPNTDMADPTSLLHSALVKRDGPMADALIARGAEIGLLEACALGDEAIVARLLSDGIPPDKVVQCWTPLNTAIRMGHQGVVRRLIDGGASVELAGEDGMTPLMHAAIRDKAAIARLLVDRGARVGLWESAMLGDGSSVRGAIEQGADLAELNAAGFTLFSAAVAAGQEAIARLLLSHGIDLAQDGLESMAVAVMYNRANMVRLLVEAGADPDAVSSAGPPLWVACMRPGQLDALRELLRLGADIGLRAGNEGTYLHLASFRGNAPAAAALLEAGADPNAVDNEGITPLHLAVYDSGACARLLIEHGANIEARDDNGYTPLNTAVLANNLPVTRLLVEAGATIDAERRGQPQNDAMAKGLVAACLAEHRKSRKKEHTR